MKPQLLLMDISNADNTSGVDRYMEVLTEGLATQTEWEVVRLHFVHDNALIAHRRIDHREKKYTEIRLPMPEISDPMIGQQFWAEKFYQTAMEILEGYGLGPDIRLIHLHTLNLIDLATLIKQKYHCPIITHLHCIPWKSYLNHNTKLFNRLYALYYNEKKINPALFLTNNGNEIRAYRNADCIICLTRCAQEFVNNVAGIPLQKLPLIANGMQDDVPDVPTCKQQSGHSVKKLLYVGHLSRSKGIYALLESLERLRKQGINVMLNAVGSVAPSFNAWAAKQYPSLQFHFPGVVNADRLRRYYQEADMGIIVSLQEQSSYVAIEMMRAALPIVTTAADGLDEMFEDGVNALKVPLCFDSYRGLRPDKELLDRAIIKLIKNDSLSEQLARNARKLYLNKHTAERMWRETWTVYHQLLNSNQA